MRSRFDEQLELLNTELIEMGSLCESAIANAAKAFIEGNQTLAQNAISINEQIEEKERKIEALCLKLLLQQQPVAKDLRQISAALKIVTDMERIGTQAADIAEIIAMEHTIAPKNISHIEEMATATIHMVTESIDAFVKEDLEMVQSVIQYDDVVDELFKKVKKELIFFIRSDAQNGENAIDILMIAKYFERIGDHAANIAQWVEFSITGRHKGEKL